MTRRSTAFRLSLLALLAFGWALPVRAVLEPGQPLPVRILLDNSGSMYPGYRPQGVGKTALGVSFFREYPQFRAWMKDFILRQSVLNAREASVWLSTSSGSFSGSDVRQIHSSRPLSQFNMEVLGSVEDWGRDTFLKESLERVSSGFEGLVWLITDNIVETPGGSIDQGIVDFYKTLRDTPRYRSVHVFKFPFRDPWNGKRSDLAAYAILISEQEVNRETLATFDRKLQHVFAKATRTVDGKTVDLFEEQQHLKLKDLRIAPVDLRFEPALEVRLRNQSFGFRESQKLVLPLQGEIRSNLGLHTVVRGRYILAVVGPFKPDPETARQFDLGDLPAGLFDTTKGEVRGLPPLASSAFAKDLVSLKPVRLKIGSVGSWFKAGLFGLRAVYEGPVKMSFDGVDVRFEQKQLTGVFGSEKASQVFQFRDEETIAAIPQTEMVSFVLVSGSARALILLLGFLPIAAALGAGLFFLGHRQGYRVTVGEVQRNIILRRFESYHVRHLEALIGKMRRPLTGHPYLKAEPGVELRAEVSEGHYLATLPRTGSISVAIEPLESRSKGVPRTGSGGGGGVQRRRPESAASPARGESAAPPSTTKSPPPPASGGSVPSPSRPRPTYRRPS